MSLRRKLALHESLFSWCLPFYKGIEKISHYIWTMLINITVVFRHSGTNTSPVVKQTETVCQIFSSSSHSNQLWEVPNHTAFKGLNRIKKKKLPRCNRLHYLSIAHLHLDAAALALPSPKSRPENDRKIAPLQRQVHPKQKAKRWHLGPEKAKRPCKLPGPTPLTWGCYRSSASSQLHLRSCGSRKKRGSSWTTVHGLQPWGSVLPESCTVPWSTTETKNTQN